MYEMFSKEANYCISKNLCNTKSLLIDILYAHL